MDHPTSITCFSCSSQLNTETSDFYNFSGKKICPNCYESLTCGNFTKNPILSADIQCKIPANPPITSSTADFCNWHQKKCKFFCKSCKTLMCLYCIPNHSEHGFYDLFSKANELLKYLRTLEHTLRLIIQNEDNSSEGQVLLEHILETYDKVIEKAPGRIVSELTELIEEYTYRLQELCKDFAGFDCREIEEMIKHGRDLMKEQKNRNYLHWCEWNDRSIHVIELETFKRTSTVLPDNKSFPYYCRSVSLPHKQILVCGGRKAANLTGLADTFIVHLEENNRIEQVDPMKIGKSNHVLLYFEGFVYCIAGCDSTNQFSNKCERFNVSTLKWEMITSCNVLRDTCSACGIEDENCIYVFGGRIGNQLFTQSIEKYFVMRNSWEVLSFKMPHVTSVHGCTSLGNNKVLIFAGQDYDSKPLKTTYLCDLKSQTFELIEETKSKGGCIVNEVIIYQNKVYAYFFQGFTSRLLESWAISKQEWQIESFS